MIREFIEFCLSAASPRARKKGYLYEAVAFESRGRRNKSYWQPHWDLCHELVKEFCDSRPEARSLVILGSGCLFEVPKDWLAQRFDRIILIDQVFPRSVKSWCKKNSLGNRIEMIEMDLADSAVAGELAQIFSQVDLILSANLLSQLPLRSLMEKLRLQPDWPEEEQKKFRREVEEQHLKSLSRQTGRVLLWTDVERLYRKKGAREILEREPTSFSTLPPPIKVWTWNLAPAPEIQKEVDVVLEMKAITL